MEPKEIILIIILGLSFIIFSHWWFFSYLKYTPFNWFDRTVLPEIYFTKFDSQIYLDDNLNYTIFSSINRVCNQTVCNKTKTVELKNGENFFYFDINECKTGINEIEILCENSSLKLFFEVS